MAEKEFSELLKRLPEIAKAVNAFSSEAVQREAFAALVGALQGDIADSETSETRTDPDRGRDAAPAAKRTKSKRRVNAASVGTVFRLTKGWREPAALPTALHVTANRKKTIDTSDIENIKTSSHGRNFVEHDLPPKTGKGKGK